MKKIFCFLICLVMIVLSMLGCQYSSVKKTGDTIGEEKIIESTARVVIGYGLNSYVAIINNQEEIKELEALFKNAGFYKTDIPIQQPYLSIVCHGEDGTIALYIDDNNVIRLEDGSYVKSEQITFEKLYSIYKEYSFKKK